MTSGSHIEKRSLSTVRIADQGHLDLSSSLSSQLAHLGVQPILICTCLKRRQRFIGEKHFLCFRFTDDLNLGSLLSTERYLISNYLIFNGIPQRSIKDNLHLASLDETHLNYPFTETAVTVHLNDHAALSCL